MDSLPSILAISIRGFYSCPLISRRGTVSSDEDPFSAFLDPGLRSNTKQFIKTSFFNWQRVRTVPYMPYEVGIQ
jgi:hypothetical protein